MGISTLCEHCDCLFVLVLKCIHAVTWGGHDQLLFAFNCTLESRDSGPSLDRSLVPHAAHRGITVPEIARSRIKCFGRLAKGGQGEVFKAELSTESSGDVKTRDVAVKIIPIPSKGQSRMHQRDVAALEQVVATTFLASRSPHVCKMYGVSWAEDDVWCVAMPSQSTSTDR